MSDTLTALDATFLELEQLNEGALMSIGGTLVFEGAAPTLEQVRDKLASRLLALPRYTQRLSDVHIRSFARPSWVSDEHFDVANHVRHARLPAPGSDDQLCDFTADFFSHPLDRTRPLWEMVVVDGLDGGRWALAQKIHHCLVDGVGSVDALELLLDDGLRRSPGPAEQRESRIPDPVRQAWGAGVNAAQAGVHAALHPRDALQRSRALAELIFHDELVGAPRTSLNGPIGQLRRYAVVRVPLTELKAIRRRFKASVNDVALAACATGLRALLQERGEALPVHGLRAMVPVNVRDPAQDASLGNRVSSLFVDLPVARGGPGERLMAITRQTRRLKSSGAAAGATALLDLAALAPPAVVHAALARTAFSTRLFNLTITNVPGPQRTLYAFGAPMQELHPVVPLAAEHSIGIAIFSYDGLVFIGVNADGESTPDIEVLAYGIEQGIEELLALVPDETNPTQPK